MKADQRFWLRSPDAVPTDLNYHEPGDGNLRGYREGTFVVNKLVSANIELGTRVPTFFLGKVMDKFPGPLSWYAFYDVGASLDSQNPVASSSRVQNLVDGGILNTTLWDAGIGFRSKAPLPFWNMTMRFDLPFYVSNPELNGEEDKGAFRYLFSLSTSF